MKSITKTRASSLETGRLCGICDAEVASACAKLGAWERASALVAPDTYGFSAMISACAAGGALPRRHVVARHAVA